MPKISVVIPAYNVEEWILETIESVQQQTFSDFEIIVIDDGSTDNTIEIIGGIVDGRLKIFSYENAGVSVARNRGIAHSAGEFIAFLDADDLWTADFLELHLAKLQQHPEAGVAYCWTARIDEKGSFLGFKPSVFFEGNIYSQLLVKHYLDCGSLLIRRQAIEFIGGFDPNLAYAEDWDCWLRLSRFSSFVLVPKYQLLYRQRPGSMTTQPAQLEQHKMAYLIEQYDKIYHTVVENAFQSAPIQLQYLKKIHLTNSYLRFAGMYLKCAVGVKQGGQKLQKAIRLEPKIVLQYRTLKLLVKCLLMQTLTPRMFLVLADFVKNFVYIRTKTLNSLPIKVFIKIPLKASPEGTFTRFYPPWFEFFVLYRDLAYVLMTLTTAIVLFCHLL